VTELKQLTVDVRRDIDVEYMKRAKDFLKRSTDPGRRPDFAGTMAAEMPFKSCNK
jgi:hypothetical protein